MDDPILVAGRVPLRDAQHADRLAAYLVRGDDVLASQQLAGDGALALELSAAELQRQSAYGLALVSARPASRSTSRTCRRSSASSWGTSACARPRAAASSSARSSST